MAFYDRLNQLCKDRGTNVSSVAIKSLLVSNGTATGWKKGASPNSDVVVRAARYFDVSTDYLLGLSDVPGHYEFIASESTADADVNDADMIDADISALVHALQQAKVEHRNAAISAAYAVLDSLQKDVGRIKSYHSDLENEASNKGVV